jgi:hypothetical protein
MNNLEIFDQLVSEQESKNIEDYFLYSDVKWIYAENTVSQKFRPAYNRTEQLVDSHQLVNLVAGNNIIHDQQTFDIIRPILDNFIYMKKIKEFYIDKIKINTLFKNSDYKAEYFNAPHSDSKDIDKSTLLYYVNDSDGDTFFFNNIDKEYLETFDLELKEKISPARGKAVMFSSNQFHASSNPVLTKRRIVINIVFKYYE